MDSQQRLVERFFETLISGNRQAARQIVEDCLNNEVPAVTIIDRLIWPTLERVEKLFRDDQMAVMSHQYATRLLRALSDQIQPHLDRKSPRGKRVLVLCGPNEPNELAAQLASDLLEADGYEVHFAGGGVANDEVIGQVGELSPAHLVLFSSEPSDLPHIRRLIDELHDMGVCPGLQVVVGGGVFNRADGLSEEIGADLWASTPVELVAAMDQQADRRAADDQRTVGRRRRNGGKAA